MAACPSSAPAMSASSSARWASRPSATCSCGSRSRCTSRRPPARRCWSPPSSWRSSASSRRRSWSTRPPSWRSRAAAGALRARRHPRAARSSADAGRLRDGAAFLTADPVLRTTLAAAVAALAFFSISIAADLFYVRDVLHAGDAAYGVVTAWWMLGMVAGAVGLAPRVPRGVPAAAALAGVAVQGAGIAGAAAGGVLVGACLGLRGRRRGPRRQERPAANAHPRARARQRPRPGLRRLQRRAQRRRARGARRRRVLIGAVGARPALLVAGAVPLAIGAAALLVLTTSTPARRPADAYATT